ncbi:MAG: glycosyltransferase family 2 protein [Phycisphaerae bacterium]
MISSPSVSVIIPTYNRATVLPRALDSVIAQTMDDWEIVLVDDGSTDRTAALAARYKTKLGDRLRYLRQSNGGSSDARNAGIDACRGQLVAFLDSDDEFLPHKLARQLELLELRPELGLVYSDYEYVDIDGRHHSSVFDALAPNARLVPRTTVAPGLCVCTDLFDSLIRGYFIATIVGMVRREVLGSDIRFPSGLCYAEEWLFYLKIARICPAGYVSEPLCVHHHTAGSLARTNKRLNAVRYRDVLRAIDDAFSDLTGAQRKALHGNLSGACRQLGYDAYLSGRHFDAFGHFAESLGYRLTARSLSGLLQSLPHALLSGRRGILSA